MQKVDIDGVTHEIRPASTAFFIDWLERSEANPRPKSHEMIRDMIAFAQECTFKPDGARRWETIDDANKAAYLTVKQCGEIALIVNELTGAPEPKKKRKVRRRN